jgi:hypothetical protein
MLTQLIPLLILALVILGTITGAAYLVWHVSADRLDPTTLKRSNKGRRRSDQ